MDRSNIEQRVLNSLPPALLVYLMKNVRRVNPDLFEDKDLKEVYDNLNYAVMAQIRDSKVVALKHNVAVSKAVKFIIDELKDTRKAMLVVVE